MEGPGKRRGSSLLLFYTVAHCCWLLTRLLQDPICGQKTPLPKPTHHTHWPCGQTSPPSEKQVSLRKESLGSRASSPGKGLRLGQLVSGATKALINCILDGGVMSQTLDI